MGRNVGVKQYGYVLMPGANWSCSAMGAVSSVNKHKLSGTGSTSEFKLRSNTFSDDIKPTTEGMVLTRRLSASSKYSRLVNFPRDDGIEPSISKL